MDIVYRRLCKRITAETNIYLSSSKFTVHTIKRNRYIKREIVKYYDIEIGFCSHELQLSVYCLSTKRKSHLRSEIILYKRY